MIGVRYIQPCVARDVFITCLFFRLRPLWCAKPPRIRLDNMSWGTCGCALRSLEPFFSDDVVLYTLRRIVVVEAAVFVLWCVRFCRKVALAVEFVKRCSGAASHWLGARLPRDELDKKVNEIVSTRKARQGWACVAGIGLLLAPYILFRFVELHLVGVWGPASNDALREVLFGQGMVGLAVLSILCTLSSGPLRKL